MKQRIGLAAVRGTDERKDMVSRALRHLSFSNVIAVIALFAALGGAAYAAKALNGKSIKTNSIPAKKLKCPSGTTRHGAICYTPLQTASGWIAAAQTTCVSKRLRLPTSGEALLITSKVGGETWSDDVIVEGLAGSAARVSAGTVFATPIGEAHGFRCVTTAG
jgi:hypothetical protein